MKPNANLEQPGAAIAGRYQIEQTLGHGGMAVVYRVLDRMTNRQVALKRSSSSDALKAARYGTLLEREYHTLSQLAHPHIVAVHDYGVDAKGPYYTMELLSGSDLQKVDRLPWQSACTALHDVASALALLHSRGLLHRDVSMRNVNWSEQGRAKLFDFGAMVTLGIAKQVVGTPPFVAPEALQLQALDARTDIFSLGALGYRLLTGRHAFTARSFSDLRDAWRSRPGAPNKLVPEIPAELSALVLRMLTLDRAGRPQSVGEIIEQLRAMAPIEPEAIAEISRGYLTTPTLVGRAPAQLAMRKQILGLARKDGGALMFRGVPGAGRSRMLDACALEGKLVGASVVRADARDAAQGEWGVARTIGGQLIERFPKESSDAARLVRNDLSYVLEELGSHGRPAQTMTMTGHVPERSVLVRTLRDWLLAICKSRPLIIIVDDLERVDDVSLAWLAAVAHKSERHPILIAGAVVDDVQRSPSTTLQTLLELSDVIELQDLAAQDTEALMRSVFGEVANVSMCAVRIHQLSHGNPRAVMELAQHLVSTGRASYQSGTWILPQTLAENELPATVSASLLARLRELDSNAFELAEILALVEDDAPLVTSYPSLTRHGDAARVFRAVAELVAARIVIADGERCYFAQRGFIAVLQQSMAEERRRALHARMARLLSESGGDSFRRAHHFLGAGMDARAIQLLEDVDLTTQVAPSALLARAVERAEVLGVAASTLHRLRMGLLIAAPFSMDDESFRRVAPVVLERLVRDSGLARYRELTDVPEHERLALAIAQTQQAYTATPEHEKVYAPLLAIRELARLVATVPAVVVPLFDTRLRESLLPDISPLFPLSPSLPIVAKLLEGVGLWGRGQYLQARLIYEGLLTRLAEPDRGGFDEAQYERMSHGIQMLLAAFEAGYGIERAEHRAKLFEQHRELRVNAWRIRGLLQLAIGNSAEATRSMRRAELLQAQEGLKERFVNSTMAVELILRSRLGDLTGIKAQLPILSSLAERYAGWLPVHFLGRSRYCELQGDFATALELALAGLELVKPGRHAFFGALAASHMTLLAELGRLEEAVDVTHAYVRACERQGVSDPDIPLRGAIVLARAGRCEEAVQLLQPHIDEAERLGRSGFAAGSIYEVRARVAIAARDAGAYQLFAARCAREFEKSHNPALGARLAVLADEAQEHGLLPSAEADEVRRSLQPVSGDHEHYTLYSRIEECVDAADRARCSLTLLLENTLSNLGYLFLTRAGGQLVLNASLPDEPTDPGVAAWAERYAKAWFEAAQRRDEGATQSAETSEGQTESVTNELTEVTASALSDSSSDGQREISSTYLDAEGRHLQIVMLGSSRDSSTFAGVLVVQGAHDRPTYVPTPIISGVARELLRYGDSQVWNFS